MDEDRGDSMASKLSDYVRGEMWKDRVIDTINTWEKLQGIKVSKKDRDAIVKFMSSKIDNGIRKGTLIKTFMQIAVTSLIYIKTKKGK